ncbi:MAG: hypothetical protein GC131_08610 [Alphaproteobacteria bacterium]|nr:hypothetical protein [Alphaproteobacteria bacterium]
MISKTTLAYKMPLLALAFLGASCLPLFFPSVQASSGVFYAMAGGNILLALSLGAIFLRNRALLRQGFAGLGFKMVHLVQVIVHLSIYAYWGYYYAGVIDQAPLIVCQILFGYLIHMAVSLARSGRFTLDLSVLPIVFSINFFVWFKNDFFWAQLLMVAGAVLGKAFITRVMGGRKAHIFNPSALAMAVVIWGAIAFEYLYALHTITIVASFEIIPHFFTYIFIVGAVSLFAARVALVAFGAFATLIATNALSLVLTDVPLMPSLVHPNIFLALTLLITDPATAPKTKIGQLLFGISYGLSVIFAYALLSWMGKPTLFDKIIFVPVLNYLAPCFDRIRLPIRARVDGASPAMAALFLAFYTAFFFSQNDTLERQLYHGPHLLRELGGRQVLPEDYEELGMKIFDQKLLIQLQEKHLRLCREGIKSPACF